VPKIGDAIIYDWEDNGVGENTDGADHIGIVTKTSNKGFTVTEGNMGSGYVGVRDMNVNGRYIRGFITPNYANIAKKVAGKITPDSGVSTPVATTSSDTKSNIGNSAVKQIQTWLNTNYKTGLAVDGAYGAKTKAALVKALQTELNKQTGAKLVVDGIYGSKTNAAVINIQLGSQGNITRTLQGLLICNGYSTNGFDGVFGNGTRNAVIAYQRAKGLTADGIAGKYTFAKLCA
jgi:peptidoglycan hydrolase-like protein with peptidoglycan-binding domain